MTKEGELTKGRVVKSVLLPWLGEETVLRVRKAMQADLSPAVWRVNLPYS